MGNLIIVVECVRSAVFLAVQLREKKVLMYHVYVSRYCRDKPALYTVSCASTAKVGKDFVAFVSPPPE